MWPVAAILEYLAYIFPLRLSHYLLSASLPPPLPSSLSIHSPPPVASPPPPPPPPIPLSSYSPLQPGAEELAATLLPRLGCRAPLFLLASASLLLRLPEALVKHRWYQQQQQQLKTSLQRNSGSLAAKRGQARMLGAARKGVKLGSGKEAPAPPPATAGGNTTTKVPAEEVWEVRPGGMLVQKRGGAGDDAPPPNVKPVPTIRVKAKVKHSGATHEIYISAEASFGELKRLVAAKTGLHPDDQKVMYKDRERDSKAFLDVAGVRDRSKVVVLEDPEARARRLIEERRNGHLEKAARAVADVTAEVDKLAPKVAALDASVRKGEKVAENDVVQVTEMLMNELLKLDAVVADGDVKAQRRMQVKRVQRYVETLDAVAAKNAAIARKSGDKAAANTNKQPQQPRQQQQSNQHRQQQPPASAGQTRWETFDLLSSLPSTSSASSTTTVSSTASSGAPPPTNRLDWMLF
ncbi:hypothetical protein BS78_10G019000 [Paspalum vaginatum]|nr:hypothetical protein BS78_10G019000 [Paspalum vaginatum]